MPTEKFNPQTEEMIVDYDLGFDNPYQKSFSEYQRYKSSIFEDEWWLEDPIYTYLYKFNPQPQAEKGTYIESR